jgi:hypothetical protein
MDELIGGVHVRTTRRDVFHFDDKLNNEDSPSSSTATAAGSSVIVSVAWSLPALSTALRSSP